MSKFKAYSVAQGQLLPQNLDDDISPDHIARLINTVVDELDLSFIEKMYSIDGRSAYHPKMLTKVLVYGYTIGVRSSRKLADRLHEDVVFMWLSGRQSPDFRTISDFRKSKLIDVKKIFIEVLNLCRQLGMVRVGKVSIDGTKFRGNANGNRMQYRKILEKRKKTIEEQVNDIFDEVENIDREEDEIYGDSTEHTGVKWSDVDVKKILGKMARKKKSLANKVSKLQSRKIDIDSKLRKMRKDRNSMSSTDKDATMMLMKEQYIAPGYNAQIATERQVILAYDLSSNRNDNKLLRPMIEAVRKNTGKYPEFAIADAGYGSKMNYRFLNSKKITSFIPYNNFNKEMSDRSNGIYTHTKDKELARYKFTQQMRLKSKEGERMMKRRREDVEPTFGDIKRNMNFRTFGLRGKTKCSIELGLISIGHNIKKVKSYLKKASEWNNGNMQVEKLGMILGYQLAS